MDVDKVHKRLLFGTLLKSVEVSFTGSVVYLLAFLLRFFLIESEVSSREVHSRFF